MRLFAQPKPRLKSDDTLETGFAHIFKRYNPQQRRDAHGRWTSSGGGSIADKVVDHILPKSMNKLPRECQQPVNTKEDLFAMSEEALAQVKTFLNEGKGVASQLGYTTMKKSPVDADEVDMNAHKGMLFIAPIKGMERSIQKVENDYGGDWSKLLDTVRASIVVDDIHEVKKVMDALVEKGFVVVKKPKNRFAEPTKEGYRDLMLNFKAPNGIVAELQVHTKAMFMAKKQGHKFYETVRDLYAKNNNTEPHNWSAADFKAYKDAVNASKRVYNRAWED